MNKKPLIFIAACIAAVAVFCIAKYVIFSPEKSHTDPADTETGMVFVALQPVKGLEIEGENPISITPGTEVSFKVTTDSDHYILESDRYTYENGLVDFGVINTACTLYVSLGSYYKVNVSIEGNGSASVSQSTGLKTDDVVSVTYTPDDGYMIKSIKINDIYQQIPEEDTFSLTISGDCSVEIAFEEIPEPPRTVFNVILMENGEATVLYADQAPGTLVDLPLGDADTIKSSDSALIGYNTAEDYSGEYYALGSILTVGNDDTILYPQTYKYDDEADFGGFTINSYYVINKYMGTPTDGVVCIPPYIQGCPVLGIMSGSFDGVADMTTLICPVGIKNLENGVINNCPEFTTLVLPQTIEQFSSASITNCPEFKNFRVIGTIEHKMTDSFDAALCDKFLRLQNTTGNRIIVVSGSSSAFGLTSQELADAFPDYTIINFGNSYLIGMHMSLELLSAYVHEGDIVILAPEYLDSTYANTDPIRTTVWHSLESNLNMLNYLDAGTYTAFMDSFAEAMGIIRSYSKGNKYVSNKYQSRSKFNEYGDLASVRPVENTTSVSSIYNPVTTKGMALINSYVDDFAGRGVTCLFSFPAIYAKTITDTLVSSSEKLLASLHASLSENCLIISDPIDYAFTDNLFYNSAYHATLEGASKRTSQLISDLNAYFESLISGG